MSDEQPVVIQASKKIKLSVKGEQSVLACIVHYHDNKEKDVKKLTEHSFSVIRESVAIRQRQINPDWRLDTICASVPSVG